MDFKINTTIPHVFAIVFSISILYARAQFPNETKLMEAFDRYGTYWNPGTDTFPNIDPSLVSIGVGLHLPIVFLLFYYH